MQKHELSELNSRLAQLADALGGKPPSPAGLLVWGDALGECSLVDVLSALTDWPKRNVKMPAPADILKTCRERSAVKREADAAIAREQEKSAPGLDAAFSNARSPVARTELAKMRAILADCDGGLVAGSFHHVGGRPNSDHKEWARVLRVRHEAGDQLSLTQIAAYKGAL